MRIAKSMSKFFYNIADKNACFSINYKILVTRDTITNTSIGWLQTRQSGPVKMKIISVKLAKTICLFRACLDGGGGPQVGEVTCLGGVTRLSL